MNIPSHFTNLSPPQSFIMARRGECCFKLFFSNFLKSILSSISVGHITKMTNWRKFKRFSSKVCCGGMGRILDCGILSFEEEERTNCLPSQGCPTKNSHTIIFLAVQRSSIDDFFSQSLSKSLLNSVSSEHCRAVVDTSVLTRRRRRRRRRQRRRRWERFRDLVNYSDTVD